MTVKVKVLMFSAQTNLTKSQFFLDVSILSKKTEILAVFVARNMIFFTLILITISNDAIC